MTVISGGYFFVMEEIGDCLFVWLSARMNDYSHCEDSTYILTFALHPSSQA